MRKKLFVMMIALLTLMVGSAQADGLTVDGVTMTAGAEKTVGVTLAQPTAKYAGFQFDLVLPAGVTLTGQSLVKEQTGDMVLTHEAQADGSIRILAFSPSLAPAKAGKVMELQLKAGEQAKAGTYSLKLTNIVLTDAKGNTVKADNAAGNVTISQQSNIIAGDINGNGEVDDEDVDAFIELYLDDEVPEAGTPEFDNFDANGDGIITLADAVAIFYLSNGLNYDGTDPNAARAEH